VIAGEASVTEYFADEQAAIFMIAMDIGSEVEVHGRIVVASPYEHEVDLVTRERTSKLSRFNELVWLGGSNETLLRSKQDAKARVVVFTVGRDRS
jgi:hypothetical protein